MSLPVLLVSLCASAVYGQVYLASSPQAQGQSTKMAPHVYYKAKEVGKVTTAEPSTEPSQQYYSMGENSYYQDYKASNLPLKYTPDYGQTSETPMEYSNTTPSTPPNNPADIEGHLNTLLKLLLTSKVSSPKFLLLLPLTGKGGGGHAKPESPQAPTTVKPKPRKKTKYIVVN